MGAMNFSRHLKLQRPIYQKTAENGHFGNSEFPWEQSKTLTIPTEILTKLQKSDVKSLKVNGDHISEGAKARVSA